MSLRSTNSKGKASRAQGAARDENRRRLIGSRRSLVLLASLTVLLAASISLAAAGAFAPLLRPAPPRPPEPPTPPAPTITARPADPTNQDTAHFGYADAQSGVNFECQLDGGSFGSCPTSGTSYGRLSERTHTFKVRAASGQRTSSTTSYSWTVDTTAPTVWLSHPDNGAAMGAGDWGARCPEHAAICGSARDGVGVGAVTISIQRDGGRWWGGSAFDQAAETFVNASLDGRGRDAVRWSYPLHLPADGSYTVHVRASDEAGNQTTPASQASARFSIDTTPPPAPTITAQPAASTTSRDASFSFLDGEHGVTLLCRRDGGRYERCASPLTYRSLSLGAHSFQAQARDAVGNTSASASYSWTIVKELAKEEGKPFTVSGSAAGPLAPGTTQPLAITLSNPNNVTITVTALSVTTAPGSSKAGCDGPTNLALTQSNLSEAKALTIAAGAHATLPSGAISAPQVLMKDLPVNQDACKGAAFSFIYSGSAHS